MLNFVKVSLCIFWDDHLVLSFNLLILCIIVIVLCMRESLNPWDKVHLIMMYDQHIWVVGFCLQEFLLRILHLHSLVILACRLLFCSIFVWFWYQNKGGFREWVQQFSFLHNFLEEFKQDRHFSSKFWQNLLWSPLTLVFFCLEKLLIQFLFLWLWLICSYFISLSCSVLEGIYF